LMQLKRSISNESLAALSHTTSVPDEVRCATLLHPWARAARPLLCFQEVERLRAEVQRQRDVISELEATTSNVCTENEKVFVVLWTVHERLPWCRDVWMVGLFQYIREIQELKRVRTSPTQDSRPSVWNSIMFNLIDGDRWLDAVVIADGAVGAQSTERFVEWAGAIAHQSCMWFYLSFPALPTFTQLDCGCLLCV
jgi:hypothetical protein